MSLHIYNLVREMAHIIEHFYIHSGYKIRDNKITTKDIKLLGLARKNGFIYKKRNGKLDDDVLRSYVDFRLEELNRDLVKLGHIGVFLFGDE